MAFPVGGTDWGCNGSCSCLSRVSSSLFFSQRKIGCRSSSSAVFSAAELRAKGVADGTINGLNMLMLSGGIADGANRTLLIQKMGSSEKIKELRIVRGKAVVDRFGGGLPQEQPVDQFDRVALSTGKTQFNRFADANGEASLHAVVPFIAQKDFRGTNCLGCHGAEQEGKVLGAASLTIDIKDDLATLAQMNSWIWVGQGILQIVLFFVIGLIVRRTLKQLGGEPEYGASIARRIATGDLGGAIDTKPNDQSSWLAEMKAMRDNLARIVSEVRGGIDTIASASMEIACGNQNLSSRTEQQANSLQEDAASMEDMASTVRKNLDHAPTANQLAESASDVALRGGAVIAQVVHTMDSINASSGQVFDIIGVIDSIAFQTNILALNAVVEAARAGEQGRGGAVVAAEVRTLAQRSASAAKEIKNLIGHSVQAVDEGCKLVKQDGSTMGEIVVSVRRVNGIMAQITSDDQQQTTGIDQINQAIMQMDEMTRQNATLVEQAAAAAMSLEEQTRNLTQLVSTFKLGDRSCSG